MKIKLEKKYVQIGITIFLTALSIMAVYFLVTRSTSIAGSIKKINSILSPVYVGLVLAYLVTPAMNGVENKWIIPLFDKNGWLLKKTEEERKKKIRVISLSVTVILILFALYLFFKAVIPEVYNSINTLLSSYSTYTENLVNWVNDITVKNPELAQIFASFVQNATEETDNFLNGVVMPAVQSLLLPNINEWILNLTKNIVGVFKVIWNSFIGIIISFYILNSKEKVIKHSIKLLYAFFDTKFVNKFLDSIRFIHHTFIGFLSGKILDSFIIGIICYISCLILGLKYASLISLIIGVTNIIPFVGPIIGAVPCVILLLMVEPKQALVFIIFVLILQQVDGNIIGPKILGGATGLDAFWILFSITLFGGMWGIPGMIIGVPITAVALTGLKSISNKRLETKNLPVESNAYEMVKEITPEGEFVPYVYVKTETEKQKANRAAWAKLSDSLWLGAKNLCIAIGHGCKILFLNIKKLIITKKEKSSVKKTKKHQKNMK